MNLLVVKPQILRNRHEKQIDFLLERKIPFFFFIVPFAIIHSSGEGLEGMKSPLFLLFTLAPFASPTSISFQKRTTQPLALTTPLAGSTINAEKRRLMSIYAIIKIKRNLKRILNGELIIRTGELYIVSSRLYGVRDNSCYYRFAIRNHSTKNGYPEVMYDSKWYYEKEER